jgi:hypothetical protein
MDGEKADVKIIYQLWAALQWCVMDIWIFIAFLVSFQLK